MKVWSESSFFFRLFLFFTFLFFQNYSFLLFFFFICFTFLFFILDGVYANKTSDLLGKLLRKEIDFPQS